jgi:hypothetical protein
MAPGSPPCIAAIGTDRPADGANAPGPYPSGNTQRKAHHYAQ